MFEVVAMVALHGQQEPAGHLHPGRARVAAQKDVLRGRLVVFVFYCFGRLTHMVAPMLQGGNFIVDREAMMAVGGFDVDTDFYGEDTLTAVRLAKAGKIKFNLGMYCYSSARRIRAEGLLRSGSRYAINYLWVWISGHPWTDTHADHRENVA